jgi:hypothetical protein
MVVPHILDHMHCVLLWNWDVSVTPGLPRRLNEHPPEVKVPEPDTQIPILDEMVRSICCKSPSSWRDVTAGDGSLGPKWIPKPELKK